MKIEQINPDKLIPYANNARQHDEIQIAQIAGSIKAFGFNQPILIDKENVIIAGHGRLFASLKLDLKTVPCVRLEHLTETEKQAYILADNKIALNATWDSQMLNFELSKLQEKEVDLSLLGFSEVDFARMQDDKDEQRLNDMIESHLDNEDSEKIDLSNEMFPLSVMLEFEQRNIIFQAIKEAKQKHSLENSGQALWSICKEYLK